MQPDILANFKKGVRIIGVLDIFGAVVQITDPPTKTELQCLWIAYKACENFHGSGSN